MNKDRTREVIEYTKEIVHAYFDVADDEFTNEDEINQVLDIIIKSLDNEWIDINDRLSSEKEIYWEYNGNGNDSGTELEIRCIYCNTYFRISSPDENKPFSYFTTRQNLDEYAPRECPQCKHKMIGYKILSHEIGIGAKPDEMRYFKDEY